MGLLLALTAVASVAAGVNAQCTSLADAAMAAGLTGLMDTIGGVVDEESAAQLLEMAISQEPLDTPVTVFAPTNEAFEEIAGLVATLDDEIVFAVLINHILPSMEDSASLAASAPSDLVTLLGTSLFTTIVDTDLILTPASTTIASKVIMTDIETCAGIVHVVDKVLLPVVEVAEGPDSVAPPPRGVVEGPVSVVEGPTSVVVEPTTVVEGPTSVVVEPTGVYGDELDAGYGF